MKTPPSGSTADLERRATTFSQSDKTLSSGICCTRALCSAWWLQRGTWLFKALQVFVGDRLHTVTSDFGECHAPALRGALEAPLDGGPEQAQQKPFLFLFVASLIYIHYLFCSSQLPSELTFIDPFCRSASWDWERDSPHLRLGCNVVSKVIKLSSTYQVPAMLQALF